MARKAIQKAENICVKKFTKHCIEQTKLFTECDTLPDGFKVDIFSKLTDKTPYWIELKHTTKYDLAYMKQFGAMMEKDKLTNIRTIVNEIGFNGMYLRFLEDGWMAWDVNKINNLSEDNKQRKATKVSNRRNNTKNDAYWLLDWSEAMFIYDYKNNNVKQQWLDETITKYPKITIEELKQRLQQNKTFNNE